jgi:serine/threonine protein phosphatase PrpC
MTQIETASATAQYRERCEDRLTVLNSQDRTVIVVADGAGGVGSGDRAAESVIREVTAAQSDARSGSDWQKVLRQIDNGIAVGESTAVVVDIRPYGIAGASVGDSQAWIVIDGQISDLTSAQIRKPLLGSGMAEPVAFSHPPLNGLLIVATDGIYDYAKRDEIVRMVSESDFYEISRKCIDLVRLPTGELWDDVGIVLARNRPRSRTRKKYEI